MTAILFFLAIHVQRVVSITPGGNLDFREPQVAVEDDGHVTVAYGSGNAIYVSSSADKGVSYFSPVKVAEAGKLSLGMRRGPRISAFHGIITVTAVYGGKGKGSDGDILTFQSTDHGTTWKPTAKVNDVEGSAREGLHAMAVSPDGTLACTWLDLRSKGTKLYLSTSKDGGTTWGNNRLVYQSPSGSICECCHPSLTYDRTGKLMIMFRNSLDGARDMYLTSTGDSGATFSPATKLGNGTWMLNGCPMDGGMVSVDAKGKSSSVWRRENDVFMSGVGSKEILLGPGKQPWGAFGPDGLYSVWWGTNGIVATTPQMKPFNLSSGGGDPVISSSPDHKVVVAAWSDGGIRSARLAP